MKKAFLIVWTIIGLIILCCFAGCIYGCGKTAVELDKAINDEDGAFADLEDLTTDRSDVYNWVKTGMTKQQVRNKFGEPRDIQQMESDISGMMEGMEDLGIDINTKTEMEYWYYGNVQIGFINGKVSSKMKI